MRKQAGKWKRAALMVAFAGILSAPAVPAYAAEDKEPVSAASADETNAAEAEREKAMIEAEKKIAAKASQKKETSQKIQDATIQADPEDGWNEDHTKYYEGGTAVTYTVKQIDGLWYGFDWDGTLFKDQTFTFYTGGWYRAKSDGTLYSDEWVEDGEEYDSDTEQYLPNRYYYQEGGASPSDQLFSVNGVKYYFDYYGKMERSFSRDIGGSVVFVNSDGKATEKTYSNKTKDDWITGSVNGRTIKYRFSFSTKNLVKNKVIKIDNAFYGFDYDGTMHSNSSFWYDGNYYRAKASGQLYVNAWYKSSWEKYYYGEGGKGVKGLVTIGKKKYLFSDYAELVQNGSRKIGNDWYVSDDNGIATKLGSKDGWKTVGDNKYYLKGGELVKDTVLKIGKAYYGFRYSGQMYDGTSFSLSTYDGKEYKYNYYRAKKGGKLYVNEWFTQYYSYGDENKYYYGAGGKAYEGLKKVGKKQYCFSYEGRVMKDTVTYVKNVPYAIAKDGTVKKIQNNKWTTLDGHKYYAINNKHLSGTVQKIGSAYYGFDWNGRMYDNEVFSCSKYDEEGEWIGSSYYRAKVGGKLYVKQWFRTSYYGEGGVAPQGLTKIGKKLYYFESEGEAVVNEYISVDNACYHASAKGVLTKVKKNGLVIEDPERFRMVFLAKGKPVKNTWKTIKGAKYYFGDDGYAVVGSNTWIKGKQYAFNGDGTLIKNAWVDGNGYATKSGALAVGLTKIGKKKFFFDTDGNKLTGAVKQKNGTMILLGSDGAYIGKMKTNGWSTIKGTKYYAKKGELASGLTKIGNAYYYFIEGKMCTDYVDWFYDSDAGKSRTYIFNSKGKRVNSGWYIMNNRAYYVDPKTHGTLEPGYQKIGKKYYYISYDGYAEPVDLKDDEILYTIGKNNVVTKKKKIGNGRTLFAGSYWFYKDGVPYSGWNGKCFYVEGKMLRNTETPDGYYVGNTGAVVKKVGWIMTKMDGYDVNTGMYVKKGGKLANDEWLKIGGKKYYFENYARKSSTSKIKGVWYIFDYDGKLLKKLGATPKEGWIKVAGASFFIRNGAPVRSKTINIGKKTYSFDSDGRLLKNTISYAGSAYSYTSTGLYVDKKGAAATKIKGWKKVNGNYYYFGKTGKADFGWITVSGKRYYVTTDMGRLTGYQLLDGKLYQFNKKGQLTKIFNNQNGWVKIGKKKYYFKDGTAFYGRLATISGKTYLFNYDGTLTKNEAVNGYYGDKNGVIVRNTWKKVNGSKVYYGPNGYNLSGVYKIGKTIYYFN